MNHHNLGKGLDVCYLGPPLDQGTLPALFYFSLSAEESLSLSPFNTPALYLKPWTDHSLRIFSVTIPGHENNLPKEKALETWSQAIMQGHDPITPYIATIKQIIDQLINQHVIAADQLAFAGLSRGAYIATMAAAKIPDCHHVLGFAPLVNLAKTKEFNSLQHHPLVEQLNLHQYLPTLTQTKIRFYIGNRDTRVDTKEAFTWITSLAELAYTTRAKGGSFQLILHDSIGLMGHGTPDFIFAEGTQWIKQALNLK